MQPVTLRRKRELPPVIEDTDALKNLAGLKDELKHKGIYQSDLARRAKIKASSIALYVSNKMLPGITDYNKLARVLGWKILTATGTEDSALKAERGQNSQSVRAIKSTVLMAVCSSTKASMAFTIYSVK